MSTFVARVEWDLYPGKVWQADESGDVVPDRDQEHRRLRALQIQRIRCRFDALKSRVSMGLPNRPSRGTIT